MLASQVPLNLKFVSLREGTLDAGTDSSELERDRETGDRIYKGIKSLSDKYM